MMIPQRSRVYIAIGHTDMRKSINGLCQLVADNFDSNIFAGHLFGVSFLAYLLFATSAEISLRYFSGIEMDSAYGTRGLRKIALSGRSLKKR